MATTPRGRGPNLRLAERVQERLYYGWIIVAVVFAGNLIAFNINPTFGLFVTPLEAEFGWNRGTIARSLTLGTVIGAALAPLLGWLIDRLGARAVIVTLGACSALFYNLLAWVQEAWQYNLLLGLVFALSVTGVGQMISAVAVSRWFVRRRGRAMAVVMMGASTGALIFIPLLTLLIAEIGWRDTYRVLSLLTLLLICLPAFLMMVNRPEHIGLHGHAELSEGGGPRPGGGGSGAAEGEEGDGREERPAQRSSEHSWTLRDAVRTRAFWLTLLGIMLGVFPVMGYFVHAVPHMEAEGFSRALASTVWSTFFFVGIGAKFLWGFVIERIGVRASLVALFVFEAGGMALLLTADSAWLLFTYAVLNGLGHGPFLQLNAMVWADYFGRHAVGRIYGSVQPAIVIAGSLGPWFAGSLYDVAGHYHTFFHVGIAMCLASAFIFLIDRKPGPPPQPAEA